MERQKNAYKNIFLAMSKFKINFMFQIIKNAWLRKFLV